MANNLLKSKVLVCSQCFHNLISKKASILFHINLRAVIKHQNLVARSNCWFLESFRAPLHPALKFCCHFPRYLLRFTCRILVNFLKPISSSRWLYDPALLAWHIVCSVRRGMIDRFLLTNGRILIYATIRTPFVLCLPGAFAFVSLLFFGILIYGNLISYPISL